MKKYILISLVLHLVILFGFGIIQTTQMVKDEPKNQQTTTEKSKWPTCK